ncbi:hypothetical protein BJ170DRAFT_735867 [Xylariales sp. AK1849]|nr:hypothetical protein BJ170DRAFT_735867 [Xylariales sp. AK1849]
MKFLRTATSALMASQVAHTAPVADDSSLVEYRSVNEAHLSLANLERRWTCALLDRPIRAIGTSAMTVVYITAGSGLAHGVCALTDYDKCDGLVTVIQGALSLIYAAAAHYSGAQPDTSGIATARDLDVHAAALEWWQNATAAHELSYDALDTLPFDIADEALNRRDGDPRLLTRIQISGLLNNVTGTKQDIIVNGFDGGDTVLHLPVGQSTNKSISTRVNRPGFKIAYTTRERSKLTRAHQDEMSIYAAEMWADYADIKSYNMDDFIGFAETGHSANFYYRIIPEEKGFGLNYESVNICGGMAKYL